MVQHLLIYLDISTLVDFRLVNPRALEITDSIPQWRAIATHAPHVLGCIRAIDTGRWITCESLYDKVCTAECEKCGDFGGYLYILTCKRVCFLCLSEEKSLLPLRFSHAKREYGLNHAIVKTLPRMRSIPGLYSPKGKKVRDRITLVDRESARQAGITLHGTATAMDRYVFEEQRKLGRRANWDMWDWHNVRVGPAVFRLRIRNPRIGDPVRFMAVVRMPWMNKASQGLEMGFHCKACEKSIRHLLFHWRRKFTEASFVEHLKQCGDIRDGEHDVPSVLKCMRCRSLLPCPFGCIIDQHQP